MVGLSTGAGGQDVQAEDAQDSAPSQATCRWKAIDSPLPTKCINKTAGVNGSVVFVSFHPYFCVLTGGRSYWSLNHKICEVRHTCGWVGHYRLCKGNYGS